jgi:polar amino acid transport system permease protein
VTLIDAVAGAEPAAPARRPIRNRLGVSIGALVAGAIVAGLTCWSLLFFHRSLAVASDAEDIWAIVLAAIAGIGIVVLVGCGVLAVAQSLKARGLARAGERVAARAAAARAKDWAWYVGGIGLTFLAIAFFGVFLGTKDGAVRHQYLNWDAIDEFLPKLWKGFWLNIKVFMIAEVLVLVWGFIVALARIFPGKPGAPVRFLAIAYIDLFRGFPAIITIYLVVLGMGAADLPPYSALDRPDKLFWLSVTALVLVYGAYVAEVYRAGLESIHWSQTAAARSLGLSYAQTVRFVITPQAVRRIIPPLLNDFIGLQKDTALLSVIGVLEVLNRARTTSNRVFSLSPNLAAGVAFVLITIPLARFTDWLVARDQARMRAGG